VMFSSSSLRLGDDFTGWFLMDVFKVILNVRG